MICLFNPTVAMFMWAYTSARICNPSVLLGKTDGMSEIWRLRDINWRTVCTFINFVDSKFNKILKCLYSDCS